MAGCASAALAFGGVESWTPDIGSAAIAQQARQGQGGGGRGQGSGGTSGGVAEPRGQGAGGSTAGSGQNVGGQGASTGPGPVNQNRYGGRPRQVTDPDDPDNPPTDGTTPPGDISIVLPPELIGLLDTGSTGTGSGGSGGESYLFGANDSCADYGGTRMSAQQRLTGSNAARLRAAQRMVAPDFDPRSSQTALYILANYQETLEYVRPDTDLAATYLGLVATVPLTPDMIEDVNIALCVTATPRFLGAIVETARAQGLLSTR